MSKRRSERKQARDHKREQFEQPAVPARRRGWIVFAIMGLLFAGLVGNYIFSGTSEAVANAVRAVTAVDDQVRIPLAELAGGEAKFFRYAAGGQELRFFAMKGSDGVYRAALDSCEVCYAGKRGYKQQGDEMVCNKCGQSFPSALINEVTGGCHPIGLPRTIDGDHLVLRASQIQAIDRRSAQAAGAVATDN